MRVLKRVLTRKSILGYGYAEYRDLSVQMILDLGKAHILISSYFGLDKIDFTEDILDELGITSEFRLVKPSKDKELGKLFYEKKKSVFIEKVSNLTDLERIKQFSKIKKDEKAQMIRNIASKNILSNAEYLRTKNHGHRLK
jgi:O-acetylhomoserine/O-acetylserine sulfhydrylase-like pyridoxal-dependent enzyme